MHFWGKKGEKMNFCAKNWRKTTKNLVNVIYVSLVLRSLTRDVSRKKQFGSKWRQMFLQRI